MHIIKITFCKMFRCSIFLLAISLGKVWSIQNLHPLSDEYINEINNKQSLWKAGRNFKEDEYDLFKVLASSEKDIGIPLNFKAIHDETEDVPEYFDAREIWPDCAELIGLIKDQSRCGSCWAFAATSVMTNRICIHSNATKKMLVSPQDLITCSDAGGCHGGFSSKAYLHWIINGIVTGGLYNYTNEGCKSFFLPPCDDHMNKCKPYVDTPPCREECDDSTLNYQLQKTYGKSLVAITGTKQFQLEILKNGPVGATFDIYPDYASYKSGIYKHTGNETIGRHAVEIIGWGRNKATNTKYWTIVNSFNARWGENGLFRMLRGEDECGIESAVTAGLPDFSRF